MSDEFMSDDLFEKLLGSVREGGAILRGDKKASRKSIVDGDKQPKNSKQGSE